MWNAKKDDQLSSSKCDFNFSFAGLNLTGRQAMQSSKCDWKISAAGNKVFTSIEQSSLSRRVSGQFGGFTGLVGSDKCDYHISVKDPRITLRMDSDKCDWRLNSRTDISSLRSVQGPGFFDIKGELNNVASRMNSDKCDYRLELRGASARAALSSDKCDWKLTAVDKLGRSSASMNPKGIDLQGKTNDFSAAVSSSKCEWNVLANSRRLILEAFASQQNIAVNTKLPSGIGARASSDKCDFNISTYGEVVYPMRFDAQNPKMRMNMASSKCDWRIQAFNNVTNPAGKAPVFNASMSSSKCDFMLNIEFGILGGKPIQISAVSSSKCDFRLIGKIQERFE